MEVRRPKPKPVDLVSKITGITAVLVAIGALLAAAKPIYEAMVPIGCKAFPTWCGEEPGATKASGLPIGATGWIYVGTRVDDTWKVTEREKREPALTLRITDLPSEGGLYIVGGGVHLREKLPEIQADGSRPPMPDSIGVIGPNSQVKVDKVSQIELHNPDSTWIWAHVTLVSRGE